MTRFARCGENCLLPSEETPKHVLSASSRSEPAWVVGDRVVRQISVRSHEPGHPFSVPEVHDTLEDRAECLGILLREPPSHVLPVNRICRCSFESPFIEGRPLQDFGLGADANRLIHPAERRVDRPAHVIAKLLAQLARGLNQMHSRGLAHGDPALFNVMVVEGGSDSTALWVDLNSVRRATEETIAVDIVAFVVTTVWPALLDARAHSPSMFSELVRATLEAGDVLDALATALDRERADHAAGNSVATLQSCLREIRAARTDRIGIVQHRVQSMMAPSYFLQLTRADQDVRFLQVVLGAERARHLLLEEETTRLHLLRFKDELDRANAAIAELKDVIKKQREAIDYHAEQGAKTEKALAELNEYAQKQREAIEYHAQRAESLENALAEINAQGQKRRGIEQRSDESSVGQKDQRRWFSRK